MSTSWFLILFTFILTVHFLAAEPCKRSKHRTHRNSESTTHHKSGVTVGTDDQAGNHGNDSRIRVPTEDPVKYDGAQVFRVFVSNAKSRKRVNDLVDKGGKILNFNFS